MYHADYNLTRPNDIREFAESMNARFIWGDTPQGHTYWSEVQQNLLALVEEADRVNGIVTIDGVRYRKVDED